MSRDFQAFHQTFFDESRQLLAAARSIAADGAHASLGAAQLAELHRCVHGVAGGAATLGFDQPASLARAVEACLERFRARASSPDGAMLGCCRAALDLLAESLAGLESGQVPQADRVEAMISRLEVAVDAVARPETGGPRSIRFALSRSLAGADIVVEHVLEDLGRLGRVLRVAPPEGREHLWCIDIETEASDASLADVLDQIAEPGTFAIAQASAGSRTGGRAPGRDPRGDARAAQAVSEGGRTPLVPDSAPPGPVSGAAPAEAAAGHASFWVGDQWLAVASACVLGIDAYRGVLRMPGLPAVLRGMVAVDGEPVPLVDAHRVLGIDEPLAEHDEGALVVVIETRGGPIGLLVDRMGERLAFDPAQLLQPRALRRLLTGTPVTGFVFLGDAACGVLDPDRLCRFLEGFAAALRPLGRTKGERRATAGRWESDPAMMQAHVSSAIMTGIQGGRGPARRALARPVARRSLEEEWKQRDP